ncbi:uncharacterized protein RAG0_14785 [Rhynchosporium agropyri]|uniref:Uncharacterized protein n=1 Tax=Rhynchosporium agropyri TaxID=914238 RepID=A0A1E1LIB1_9HELO|nr:uncharacterized protein RAG0_14785 [Rhynchosporium agropyri]
MASQQDPFPSTPCSSTPLFAEPSPFDSGQEWPYDDSDIVNSHGVYLITRPRTPVFHGTYNDEFVSTLEDKLNHIITQQIWRRRKYRDAADEWLIGRTPPEIKEKWAAGVEAMTEQWNASDTESDGVSSPLIFDLISETTPGNISEHNEEEKVTGITLGKRSRGITSDENVEEDIPISTLHKRQRRSTCEENKEENGTTLISEDKEVGKDQAGLKYFPSESLEESAREELVATVMELKRIRQRRSVGKAPVSTEEIVSNQLQQNERKRLRNGDAAKDVTEEQAIKVRITGKQCKAFAPIRIYPKTIF